MLNQPKLGRLIRSARKAKGLTQEKLGDLIRKSGSTIRGYEKDVVQVWRHPDVVTDLAAALGITEEELLGVSPVSSEVRETGPQYGALQPEPSGVLKIYGAISAGHGNTSTIDPDEIDFPLQFARPDFGALWVEGDSMMPALMPSDLAIFKDWTTEKVGRIMAAQLATGEWVVKQLVYRDANFKLHSLNGDYPDIDPPFSISGFLVGVVRDEGSRRHILLDTTGLSPDDLKWP